MGFPGFQEIDAPRQDRDPGASQRRVVVVVCDSLGVGAAPDADENTGDADTLGNVARAVGDLDLPTLARWGLDHIAGIEATEPVRPPEGVVGRLTPTAAGTDSTSGHWELMCVVNTSEFPTYPEGFPTEVIDAFEQRIGRRVLGNVAASGTEIIDELGEEHLRSGRPIVYTSADSVFQIACHEQVASTEELYDWCRTARDLLTGEHRVGRVIARPFRGRPGSFQRTAERRDFGVQPPARSVCDLLHGAGLPVVAVGKIEDLFARRGITYSRHTGDDATAMRAIEDALDVGRPCFVLANLVDLDQRFGHRNDPHGYARALERIDRWLGHRLAPRMGPGDRVLVTGDHGTDPTVPGTDHTREFVPVIAWGTDLASGARIGTRETMADLGASVLDLYGLASCQQMPGTSFADRLA